MAITLKERPIFVIGAERSGTTLVMVLLGQHSRIAVPEVGWLFPRIYPWVHTYGDLNKDENLRTLADEMLFGLNVNMWGMDLNPRTAVDELLADIKERSFAGVYCAMHEMYARKNGNKPRWGQKTPHNVFFVRQIRECFPNAQFIHIVRDGRDASSDYLESSFGPTNIFAAAESWKLCWNASKEWREKLGSEDWLDIKYEDLCRKPVEVMQKVCDFLGEELEETMFDFWKGEIGQRRACTRDHKPLGHAISDKYIGIYKELLSIRDQRIFAAVAGKELEEAGYKNDVEPIEITPEMEAHWREYDGRVRAALLDSPEGHIVFESYRDWLVDQREKRKQQGIWSDADIPEDCFPIGHPHEELIVGFRAWKKWKDHFSIKRKYTTTGIVL
ncbi:sulfotransferase family protein [Desulfofalx alkaliphila]|uniref:sulfotransferase family protein n=1 Tax=Desulfofalx alkaliphila TaxID=105483 RepID=UPI0004E24976|nr:sulfotransferase [Desulfofalx alkaliphila]